MTHKKILVLGATGMAGHKLLLHLAAIPNFIVRGTVRSLHDLPERFVEKARGLIDAGIDANDMNGLQQYLDKTKPDIVINCIGLIKQLPIASQPVPSITINALFPHLLAQQCERIGCRMIHISTDCVFSGTKGQYIESDVSDATDLYGKTKYLGEVAYSHCVTLRTSIIGHELKGNYGLVEWFLHQDNSVQGFTRAIYTGFPTGELARIICNHVIPGTNLSGLYHVSSEPISKYELLGIIAEKYGKQIDINATDSFFCDRSLNSQRFRDVTGYQPPSWEVLVADMHADFTSAGYYSI